MASFNLYKDTALSFEGGYQKIASDPGNYNSEQQLVGTNYGISAPVAEQWFGYPPQESDMRSITPTIAAKIFETLYWNKIRATEIIDQGVAEMLVDHAINAGVATAAGIMQNMLNWEFGEDLAVDGVIGNRTLLAINTKNPVKVFQKYGLYRIQHYESIGNDQWFPIWKRRVESLAEKFGIVLKKKSQY